MYDVAVVGGSFAGLSAALILGRARRNVLVVDGGAPRNAPATASHGFLTRDNTSPLELLRIGREQLQAYASVDIRALKATAAVQTADGFELVLADGSREQSRKLILATGVEDELDGIAGLAELWGKGVYHCPYCFGWEMSDRPLAVIATGADAVGQAAMLRGWSQDLIVLTNGARLADVTGNELAALGVSVREEQIARLERNADGSGVRIVFVDGSSLERDGLFHTPPQHQRSDLAAALGCAIEEAGPLRIPVVVNDAVTSETSVSGVYAVGDAATPGHSVVLAVASGAKAAYAVNRMLAMEDSAAVILASRVNA